MKAAQIRQTFLDFFNQKGHEIVSSSPMVMKNDPSLMFTNAGMNQFKDFFLGNAKPKNLRLADTQKCLRVSGKHNDLEEVGVDTYHHTMFEMLGNWSFGDYFKKEAIEWAYELLVDVYGINKKDVYVTYFGGDESDKLDPDNESRELWKKFFSDDHILSFGKKDNFWEMGETGPCGPCTEIHVDIRSNEEKKKIPGKDLVNKSHPQVIEIWNLVFIQFNRNKDLSLNDLPAKHVDTGMGFERLTMVLQGKKSNYDTDIFMPLIHELEKLCGLKYSYSDTKNDIAFRVIVDHIRAVSIAIAEGQLPSNTGAGYVIRRILRRAIRYAYSYLNVRESVIYKLLPVLKESLGGVFIELNSQNELIQKVVKEEEESFLNTLEKGIERFEKYLSAGKNKVEIDGKFAFELFDTYGFPVDLTELMAHEKGFTGGVNREEFNSELQLQKERSRSATKVETGDWQVLFKDDVEEFIGYDHTDAVVKIARYREVNTKKGRFYQLVFNITPFYPEGGGQVGDTGKIQNEKEVIEILDTKKENNVIVHFCSKLPVDIHSEFKAEVDFEKRRHTGKNHSATHLLHYVLREQLGKHIEQKGSLVHPDYLRFDFSHYEKISEKDLMEIERKVNALIRENILLEENRRIPISEAKDMGAMALFGEKYGDVVRVIKFGNSIELCGGIHVPNTAEIGQFKIISEGSISAGIRRIEAITGQAADKYFSDQLNLLEELKAMLKNPPDVKQGLSALISEHQSMRKELEQISKERAGNAAKELDSKIEKVDDKLVLIQEVDLSAEEMRNIIFQLIKKHPRIIVALASVSNDKVVVSIGLSDDMISEGKLSAKAMIKEISGEIGGGGGGQDNFATAGGKNMDGIDKALEKLRMLALD